MRNPRLTALFQAYFLLFGGSHASTSQRLRDPKHAALRAGVAVPHSALWVAAVGWCSGHRCCAGSWKPSGIWSFQLRCSPFKSCSALPMDILRSTLIILYFLCCLTLDHQQKVFLVLPSLLPSRLQIRWGTLASLLVPGPHFGALMICIL